MESSFVEATLAEELRNDPTHHPPLTSSEISSLWRTQMHYSMLQCVFKYFARHTEDPNIRPLMEDTRDICSARAKVAADLYRRQDLAVPMGFTDEDVDLSAPRLYSDLYHLYYLRNMIPIGLSMNSISLTMAARADVREFYHRCVISTMRLWERAADTMLSKGIFIRPPYITTPNRVNFVDKQDFLGGSLVERRPLLAIEIERLHYGTLSNMTGKGLLMGFLQTVRSEQVRRYLKRGSEIASKHIEILSSLLRREEIPSPMHWETAVTDSTAPPFSDKLMMFHVVTLNSVGLGNYALSMAESMRHDLTAVYARLIGEVSSYAEDGLNILIDNGWFEEPPRVVDRRELTDPQKH